MKSILLFLCLLLAGSLPARAAATPPPASAAVPSYVGSPEADEANFQKFIIAHINQRVYLKLSFGAEEMMGYKMSHADPFLGLRYSYFFDCLEKQEGHWTSRCAALHFDQATNSLSGYFFITEPSPRFRRTNRMFDLKPVK